ncbi:polyprenyl synthetase family protein [Paenibacillus cymbidii]|uniref:polyprenyl synthetase family protein n=1 Tax=Paenibacillus cymbidii TaxID=1639034 RepID=UPI0010814AD3|nr:polyprenyl synthetase family protein [Paenibacillus cymbidii]
MGMDERIKRELERMIGTYATEEGLKTLIAAFIDNKATEESRWGKYTRTVHELFGGSSPLIDRAEAIAELIGLVSDIVDDLQDEDNDTVPWMTCPRPYALNAATLFLVALMAEVSALYADAGLSPATGMKEVSRLLTQSLNGQQRDLNRSVTDENDYLRVTEYKSGSLIQLVYYLGYSLVPEARPDDIERINVIAHCAGVMSQIQNDMKDAVRFDLKNDLLDKRKTLPILYLLAYSEADFPPLKQYYDGDITREQFLQHKQGCVSFVNNSGCLEFSRVVIALLKEKAEEMFEGLCVDSPVRERFRELVIGKREAKKTDEEPAAI